MKKILWPARQKKKNKRKEKESIDINRLFKSHNHALFHNKMEDIQESEPRIWNTNYYECLNAGNIVLMSLS